MATTMTPTTAFGCDSSAEVEEDELEYDMWDGQFDFVGPQVIPNGHGRRIGSDGIEDLFSGGPLTPHLSHGVNGSKKTAAHVWCDDLTDRVQLLQQQVTSLADNRSTVDDRYTRAKSENAVLQARVHALEEQLRDIELKCEERIFEEQKRCRDAVSRIERDRDSQIENLNMRLTASESESGNLRQEISRLRGISEGLRLGADTEAQRLRDAQDNVASLTQQLQQVKELQRKEKEAHENAKNIVSELQREIESLRNDLATKDRREAMHEDGNSWDESAPPHLLRLEELHQDLNRLRQENKEILEAHEELQAQMLNKGLEAGRSLLGPPPQSSLAAELTEMSNDQFDGYAHDEFRTQYDEIQKALKEQQDVNSQLRCYIDGILLSIVENYPQLLEVKHKSAS